ncbi:hypothetical protein ACFQFQ_18530 [Sulfitobacter porphyrae]|uniref:Uncharacterized protein n=1 Tax=Sulfitobacter porphyrae TaxID=1246864 RepID=A0ABW2B609_9RHOB
MRLVDPADANRGLRFDGRLSEDFKLTSGTWVRAANLRLDLLSALAPFAQDVVIAGEGRDDVRAMILPNRAAIAAKGWEVTEAAGVLKCAALEAELAQRLTALATTAAGSAGRVCAAIVLAEPASMAEGEATAKGNLNFPAFCPAGPRWWRVCLARKPRM